MKVQQAVVALAAMASLASGLVRKPRGADQGAQAPRKKLEKRGWTPDRVTNSVANYGATFFSGPNCTGDIGHGPVTDFSCTDYCWPGGRALSVMIEAWYWADRKAHQGPNEEYRSLKPWEAIMWWINRLIKPSHDGPIAIAYANGGCVPEDQMAVATIPDDNFMSCTTFDRPASSFNLRFLPDCDPNLRRLPKFPSGNPRRKVYNHYTTKLPTNVEWSEPMSVSNEEPGRKPMAPEQLGEVRTARPWARPGWRQKVIYDKTWGGSDPSHVQEDRSSVNEKKAQADREFYLAEHKLYNYGHLHGDAHDDMFPGVIFGSTAVDQTGQWEQAEDMATDEAIRMFKCEGPQCSDPSVRGAGRGRRKGNAGHERVQDPGVPPPAWY